MEDSHFKPHPYVGRLMEVFPLNQIADVGAPRSKDPKLISCEIIFEEFQPM